MRILHIIDGLFVGGAEKLLTGLCSAMKNSGTSVEVYVLRGGGPLEADVTDIGIPLHSGGKGSVYSPLHVMRLAKFLQSRHFDVIHVHLFPAQLWVCLAARIAGCRTPIVTTEHSTNNRRRTALFRCLDRWMFRQFAAVVAISEATRESLVEHVGHNLQALSVVLNGIDETRFGSVSPRVSPSDADGLTLLTVGSLTKVKDQATIIRALPLIEGAKLVMAGDGPLRGTLEALAAELGVGNRVQFLGVRHDIPRLIAMADVYVQASRWEGFCLAVVEAMCGGLPCVAARVDGLQEVVGRAGLFFDPGNAEELAATVRSLSGHPERRAALAARSIEQAKQFSLSVCRARYETLYQILTSVS